MISYENSILTFPDSRTITADLVFNRYSRPEFDGSRYCVFCEAWTSAVTLRAGIASILAELHESDCTCDEAWERMQGYLGSGKDCPCCGTTLVSTLAE